MKRIFGFVLVLLGVVGILACFAGTGYTWWFSQRYLGQMAETVHAVETLLSSTGQRVDHLTSRVGDTKTQVVSLQKAANEVIAKGNMADPADQARIRGLLAALSSKIERAEDLARTLQSAGIVVRSGADLLTSVSDTPPDLGKLQDAEKAVDQTVTRLTDARKELANAEKGGDLESAARSINDLAGKVQNALGEVTDSIGKVGEFLARGQKDLAALEQSIHAWKRYGPWVVTGVLIWIGLGQFCLLAWGWTMLFGPSKEGTA